MSSSERSHTVAWLFGNGAVRLELNKATHVFVLKMQCGKDNRFTVEMIDGINKALDTALTTATATDEEGSCRGYSLITIGTRRFYSNGLSTVFIASESRHYVEQYLLSFQGLLERILVYPLPTVAVINGHCYAGGYIFALAHDYRIMMQESGPRDVFKLGVPLAKNGYTLVRGIRTLVEAKVRDARTIRDLVLFATQYVPSSAYAANLIDVLVPALCLSPWNGDAYMASLLQFGQTFAARFNTAETMVKPSVLMALKREVYADVCHHLKATELQQEFATPRSSKL